MINHDLGGNGDTHPITDGFVKEAIDSLTNSLQKVEIFFASIQKYIVLNSIINF